MNESARYTKIVEWSDSEQCFVGSAPGLIYGGCRGDDERAVFDQLCRAVDEVVAKYRRDGTPLPAPGVGQPRPQPGNRPSPASGMPVSEMIGGHCDDDAY